MCWWNIEWNWLGSIALEDLMRLMEEWCHGECCISSELYSMPEQVNQNRATHLHSFPKHPLHPLPPSKPFQIFNLSFKNAIPPFMSVQTLNQPPPPSLPHPIPWSVLQGPYTKQEIFPQSPTPFPYPPSTNLQDGFLACHPHIQTMGLFHKIFSYTSLKTLYKE